MRAFLLKYKSNLLWSYILFGIWPFIAFMYSVNKLQHRYARIVFVLFYGIFGYTLIYHDKSDSSRHAQQFKDIATKPFSDYFNIISGAYSDEGTKPDFVVDLINFTLTRFTDNSAFFFMVLALLLGWFLSKHLKHYYQLYQQSKNDYILIFIYFFIVLLLPNRVVSFGHYFGVVVFVYAFYRFVSENKAVYLLLASLTVFIHFGFLFAVGILVAYKVIGNRNLVFYLLILLSFIFHEQATSIIRQVGLAANLGLEQSVIGYTSDKYLERVSENQAGRNVILNSYIKVTTWFFIASMIYFKWREKKFDKISESLYSFSLLFFSFVNFTQDLESITDRFSVMLQVICCVFYINFLARNKIKINNQFYVIATIFLALNGIILIRTTIEFANFLLITPFAPLALFIDSKTTILDMLK